MRSELRISLQVLIALAAIPFAAQQPGRSDSLSLSATELPKAHLWEPYNSRILASGGTEPYHWRLSNSSLPPGFNLNDDGSLTGVLREQGSFEFTAIVRDNSRPPKEEKKTFILRTEVPLTVDWKDKAHVDGQRIDGSITVSNHTGRDFDLTFIVLAVNDIGRATAIGYQHYSLKRDTQNMELPFGESLSPGNYVVNVDVVGEEPKSNNIFRARLVSGRESVTQGP
jgi:hypothetical protein